jgi:hypothetical protein
LPAASIQPDHGHVGEKLHRKVYGQDRLTRLPRLDFAK